MRIATAHLRSLAPYGQSRYHNTDKLEKESSKDFEVRTWRNRLHTNAKGEVFMPSMAFKNCLAEAAKYLSIQIPGKGKATYTKHFEAGVLVTDGLNLGVQKEEVDGLWLFVPADGRRGGGKRVEKCFPVIQEWSGQVTFYVLDETITEEIFSYVLKQAGQFIGVGFFRPRNNGYFGRFTVDKIDWAEQEEAA
jgi:hypothetical protein